MLASRRLRCGGVFLAAAWRLLCSGLALEASFLETPRAASGAAPAPSSIPRAAGGCVGLAPNGHNWLYLQPQHTGTGSVVRYLHNVMNVSTCLHGHGFRGHENTSFVFTFSANPFRRVLTSAALHNIISSVTPPPGSARKEKRQFRRWVKHQRGGSDAWTGIPNVYPVTSMLGEVMR